MELIGKFLSIGNTSKLITREGKMKKKPKDKMFDAYKLVTAKRKANDKIKNKKRAKRLQGKKARKINRV